MGEELAARAAAEQQLALRIGQREQVVVAGAGGQDRADADQRDLPPARQVEDLPVEPISISMSRCSRLSAKSGAWMSNARPPSFSASCVAR